MTDYIDEKVAQRNAASAVEPEPEPEPEPATNAGGETFESVFLKWFDRFNTSHPEAKATPHPGFLSLQRAVELVVASGLTVHPGEALRLIEQVECVTRHMHAHPHSMPRYWIANHRIDVEHWRVRQQSFPDNPQHWFAVQVAEQELRGAIAVAMARRQMAEGQSNEDAPEGQRGDFASRVAAAAGMPFAEEAIRRAEQLGYESVAEQPPRRPDVEERRDFDDAQLEALDAAMPPGFILHVTPAGFVARWQSRPFQNAIESVHEAWALHAGAEILRRKQ